MAELYSHIVHKVFVEVNTSSSAKAYDLKENANSFLKNEILVHIENYFNRLEETYGNSHVQMDYLELNLGNHSSSYSSIELETVVNDALDEKLKKNIVSMETSLAEKKKEKGIDQNTAEKIELLRPEEKSVKSIIYFFKTGALPWWIPSNKAMQELLNEPSLIDLFETEGSTFVQKITHEMDSHQFQKRLIYQLSDSVIIYLFSIHFYGGKLRFKRIQELFKTALREIKRLTPNERYQFWSILSIHLQHEETIVDHKQEIFNQVKVLKTDENHSLRLAACINGIFEIKSLLKNTGIGKYSTYETNYIDAIDRTDSNGVTLDSASNKPITEEEITLEEEKATSTEDQENFIAENAGILLLHPFIKPLFKSLDLLNDDGTLSDPILATNLLHYAATGVENDFEFTMTFEKYICGIPLNDPLPKDFNLDVSHKYAVEEMLSAALNHWTSLKTESIAILRNEFLTRPGKVFFNEQTPRITVERKAVDILLDKLPWSLGMIKLPWSNDLIYVEW
ncbi:MAG: contractile injection system tape measure protein [Crocinitomicaceae bacterium]|nr:contractile injection system tape measure protein [Crocinitomicaceae bacterium]